MKKRLLSMLMAVLMIASLVPATALAAPVVDEHVGHDVQVFNITADPAKQQPGIKLTYCNTCATDNNKQTKPIVKELVVTAFADADGICAAKAHNKSGVYVLQAATCEKPGLKVTYCTKCGAGVNVTGNKTPLVVDMSSTKHTYNVADFTVVVKPTCTNPGYGYVKCATCGEAKFVYGGGDVTSGNNNKYPSALSYLYMNKESGKVKSDDAAAVAALFNATNPDHKNDSKLVTATETKYTYEWRGKEGTDEYGKLVKVEEYFGEIKPTHVETVSQAYLAATNERKVIPTNGVFKEWTQHALKDKDGKFITGEGQVGSIYCPDCKKVTNSNVDGDKIDSLNDTQGHKLTPSVPGYLPYMDTYGVKHDGKTDTYNCAKCDTIGGVKIPYDSFFMKSFKSEGAMRSYMKDLGQLFNDESGHYGYTVDDEIIVGATKATCTTKGFTGDIYKLVGNDQDGYKWTKTTAGTYTNALGHDMKLVESKTATCTEPGWTVNNYSVCTRCGAHEGTSVVKVNKAAHNWTAKDIIAPTCKSAGMTVLECSFCHQLADKNRDVAKNPANIFVDIVKSVPHKAGDLQNVKEATCTEKGYTGDKFCVWCNTQLVKGEETAMKEHTVVDVVAVAATCTEAGANAGTKCSVCGTVLSGCEKIDALGHDFKDGKCTRCDAVDPDYKPEVKNPFTDVKEGDAFYEDILWAADKNIVDGIKADDGTMTFQANGKLTRAQVVQMLWNANGKPEAKAAADFSDVAADAWYAKAVAWAVEAGVINGMGDGTFAPNAECTRAQFVKMLWVINGSPKADAADFSDVAADAWYAQAVAWAAAQEVTLGDGEGHFLPGDSCTRGQAVAFLHRAPSLTVTAAE